MIRSSLSALRFNQLSKLNPLSRFSSCHERTETKLKRVFEEYRMKNYSHTLPSRFKKEIICVIDTDRDGMVTIDDINRLLSNIGAANRVTKDELKEVINETSLNHPASSNANQSIPVDKITQLL
mmetsp:Transcript_20727/g.30544  ORF Transcript_20727/g.30544 Transcript_20727/m.30544 type:complete len:124 (-) Transcript_20727:457-828(-)